MAQELSLFNHLVLEKILENLDFNEMKSCRQVCSFWDDVATPYVAQTGELRLEGSSLEQYLHIISRPSRKSLTKFKSCSIKINSILSTEKTVRSMWSEIHAFIKFLTLHVTTVYATQNLQSLLLQNLPSLTKIKVVVTKFWGSKPPTLESEDGVIQNLRNEISPNRNLYFFQLTYLGSISLYGFDEGDGYDEFIFPISWDYFFKRFPEITHLSVNGLNSRDVTDMLESLQARQEDATGVGDLPKFKSLEILDENTFPETPNEEHLRLITNLSYSFDSFHLELSPVYTTNRLTNLIGKFANSLKNLRLRRYPHPFTIPISLTNVSLTSLAFLEVSDCLLPSLSFLPYLPALQTFHVILRDYRNLPYCQIVQNTPNPSRISHLGVKFVYIEPPLISKECIKKLAICFPNVETLKLRVNNEMLEEICTIARGNQREDELRISNWKSLENLHITSWDGLTDEGITGINSQVLKFWGSYSSFEARKHRTSPYIGNMTALKSLTIEMWTDYENHISDWSIYYGIGDLESLQDLTLIRAGMSTTALKALPTTIRRKILY